MTIRIVRRLYFYAAAFIGLQMLAAGALGLLGMMFEWLLGTPLVASPQENVFRLSFQAALLVIGLPLWGIHWWVVQRGVVQSEERRSSLRRLYVYLVLLVSALFVLFGMRDLLAALLDDGRLGTAGNDGARSIAVLIVHVPLWASHWRIVGQDRFEVEQAGAPATLRRWYMIIIQAVSLAAAAIAAVDVLHQLLQIAMRTTFGSSSGNSASTLVAGVAVWLPHHLWSRQLVRQVSPLQAEEARSALRQIFSAVVVTVTAVAALGGVAAMLYAVLMAGFTGAAWWSELNNQTEALAVVLVALPLWAYHRGEMVEEARFSNLPARGETAQRMFGYLMAAVGLVALFFGLGGLLSTMLQMQLVPNALGSGWREPLSIYLALSLVALPVYGMTTRAVERRVRAIPDEEHALSRRIYLYAALLFGIVATVIAAVAIVRLVIEVMLGTPEPDFLAQAGQWGAYALIAGLIAVAYGLLLRRSGGVSRNIGKGITIAVVAEEPLREALVAAVSRELPGATIRATGVTAPEMTASLEGVSVVILKLADVLEAPLAESIRAFSGRRILLAGPVPGYEVIGVRRREDALVREAVHALRSGMPIERYAPTQDERPRGEIATPAAGMHQ